MGCCQSKATAEGPVHQNVTKNTQLMRESQENSHKILEVTHLSEFRSRFQFVAGELGQGSFAQVRKAIRRDTGKEYAVKIVNLVNAHGTSDWKEIKQEIKMLRQLDHPNLVKLHEVYHEKGRTIYLIEQYCAEPLMARSPYSERAGMAAFTHIMRGLKYLHDRGICHRDLKVENIMFESKAKEAVPVLIDFGAATHLTRNKLYTEVGTPYTRAPEAVRGDVGYALPSDLWSAGVVLYMILCHMAVPFHGETMAELYRHISSGEYDTKNASYLRLSVRARDLIHNLLQVDPKKRFTVDQALAHPCLQGDAEGLPLVVGAESVSQRKLVRRNMVNYVNRNALQQEALRLVAHQMSPEQISDLRKLFYELDTEKTGSITFGDFKQGLFDSKALADERKIQAVFNAVDVSRSGRISYNEFIAAALDTHRQIFMSDLVEAFNRLDRDGDGGITLADLESLLPSKKGRVADDLRRAFRVADKDGEGVVTWEQWIAQFPQIPSRAPVGVGAGEIGVEGSSGDGLLSTKTA